MQFPIILLAEVERGLGGGEVTGGVKREVKASKNTELIKKRC
jgi:hypothetical protein